MGTIVYHKGTRQLLIFVLRSNEIDPLLSTRSRRNNGPGCCFLTILGAVLLSLVFAIVFFSFISYNEVTWTNVESHSCTTYATREYIAELHVSPLSRHQMDICIATPVVVHGWPHWASRCEEVGQRFSLVDEY